QRRRSVLELNTRDQQAGSRASGQRGLHTAKARGGGATRIPSESSGRGIRATGVANDRTIEDVGHLSPYVQGYGFAKPESPSKVEVFLRTALLPVVGIIRGPHSEIPRKGIR